MKKNKRKKINKNALILYTFALIILIFASIFTLIKSFTPKKEKEIKYSETSNVNYKVYLKENNFYEQDYLEGNMIYVASLIDKININFNYNFSIDETATMDFDYSIVGKLVVSDESGLNDYYKKTYTLVDTKTAKIENATNLLIQEAVDIKYNFYNDIVNEFRKTYGLNVDSRLEVYMLVTKRSKEDSPLLIDNINSYMSFTIPLSEKSVNVKMDYKDLAENSYVIVESDAVISNKFLFIISCILIFTSVGIGAKWVTIASKFINKKSKYDKYVNKILKEYDRLIAETNNLPPYDDYNIIAISKFSELVDVHDNINLPIMYYSVKEEKKSYFYILHHENIYLHTISDEYFGEKNEKK